MPETTTEARKKEAERSSADASGVGRLNAQVGGEGARERDELRPLEEAEPSETPEDTRTTRPSSGSASGSASGFGKSSGGSAGDIPGAVPGGIPGGVPGGVVGGSLGGLEKKSKGDSSGESVEGIPGVMVYNFEDREKVEKILKDAVNKGFEGVDYEKLDAAYQKWIKNL